jgi:general secretion pathway protein G
VVLVILSVLASAALPYAEMTVRRQQELELRRALREIRSAIDRFHDDWAQGRIAATSGVASADGYPLRLEVLVDGVPATGSTQTRRFYLRRIPPDPLARDGRQPAAQTWLLRSYQDGPDSKYWGGQDVYDVRSSSDATAIDGSRYATW